MNHDINYWKNQIRKNPNSIYKCNDDILINELVDYIVESGLKLSGKGLVKANRSLQSNEKLSTYLVDQKPSNIKYINSRAFFLEKLAIRAVENGYKPSLIDYRLHPQMIGRTPELFKELVKKNPSIIKEVKVSDESLFKLALENGYKPKLKDLQKNKNLCSSDDIVSILLDKDPNNIKYYTGYNSGLVKSAINKGYKPNKKDTIKNVALLRMDDIVLNIIEHDPSVITEYTGYNEEVFEKAFSKGFDEQKIAETLSLENEGKKHSSNISCSTFLMKKLVDRDPQSFNYYRMGYYGSEPIDSELMSYAIQKGFKPDDNFLKRFNYNSDAMSLLIEVEPTLVEKCPHGEVELYKKAVEKGYNPPAEIITEFENNGHSLISKSLISRNPEVIKLYQGKNEEILSFAIKNNLLDINTIKSYNSERLLYAYIETTRDQDVINEIITTGQPYSIKLLLTENSEFDFTLKTVIGRSAYGNCPESILTELLENSNPEDCLTFLENQNFVYDHFTERLCDEKFGGKLSSDVLRLASDYTYDKITFLKRYNDLSDFLQKSSINVTDFMKYGLNSSYNYLDVILNIIDNNKTDEFIYAKDLMLNNFYSNSNNIEIINNYISVIRSYNNYPELISEILSGKTIPEEHIEDVKLLFNYDLMLDDELVPKSIEDVSNIKDKMKVSFGKRITNKPTNEEELKEYKDALCKTLFTCSLENAQQLVGIYGGREGLRQLLFENRNNKFLEKEILESMMLISFIEDVVNINDPEKIFSVAQKSYENFDLAFDTRKMYQSLKERLKVLYEHEHDANLTKIDFDKDISSILDDKTTKETGVQTVDLSDKQYCLLFHVKSRNESIEQLANSESTGNSITISTSVGSHRNLRLFNGSDQIIFAADEIPEGLFCKSSDENMSSNQDVNKNSSEISGQYKDRNQRGILSTSIAPKSNSEVLTYRDGFKFKYIVLPGGREPTEKEIEIAKTYNLKFVKTQELETSITSPKKIDDELLVKKEYKDMSSKSEMIDIKDKVLSSVDGPKRIAVFSDAHALFEPTLAILEDARKNGITDIYSLGDNIGTGPNPKEVMELLNEYGVKSIKGNHEEYIIDGIEKYEEHLKASNALDEAKRNVEFTKSMLTEEQLKQLESLPESIQLEIGNEVVYLTHYTKDYNTGKDINIPNEVTKILQGHIHRYQESEDKNITALRGAGIGYSPINDEYTAQYYIITERPDGTYDIQPKSVRFNGENLKHDINESSMFYEDKKKIADWSGVGFVEDPEKESEGASR